MSKYSLQGGWGPQTGPLLQHQPDSELLQPGDTCKQVEETS